MLFPLCRPQALHFVSMPPVVESMFNMVQGLQKEKMRKRNHVHPKVHHAGFSFYLFCHLILKMLQLSDQCCQGDMSKVVADLGPEVQLLTMLCKSALTHFL